MSRYPVMNIVGFPALGQGSKCDSIPGMLDRYNCQNDEFRDRMNRRNQEAARAWAEQHPTPPYEPMFPSSTIFSPPEPADGSGMVRDFGSEPTPPPRPLPPPMVATGYPPAPKPPTGPTTIPVIFPPVPPPQPTGLPPYGPRPGVVTGIPSINPTTFIPPEPPNYPPPEYPPVPTPGAGVDPQLMLTGCYKCGSGFETLRAFDAKNRPDCVKMSAEACQGGNPPPPPELPNIPSTGIPTTGTPQQGIPTTGIPTTGMLTPAAPLPGTTPPPVASTQCPPGQFWDGRQCRGSVGPMPGGVPGGGSSDITTGLQNMPSGGGSMYSGIGSRLPQVRLMAHPSELGAPRLTMVRIMGDPRR